jgi:hypothetical protein
MQLTQKERDETLANCRKKARQCRETAGRIRLADQREAMEQTAKMWDDLATSLCDPVAALPERAPGDQPVATNNELGASIILCGPYCSGTSGPRSRLSL